MMMTIEIFFSSFSSLYKYEFDFAVSVKKRN